MSRLKAAASPAGAVPPAAPRRTGAGGGRDPYLALRHPAFRRLLAGALVAQLGQQMLGVALGWELYNRTGSALALGGVGLAQIIPILLLTLPAGQAADRYSRGRIVAAAQGALALAALGLAALSASRGPLPLVYACLAAAGAAQAFGGPAGSALVSDLLPAEAYESGTTWRSSTMQLAFVLGPAAGGLLVGVLHGATFIYVLSAGAAAGYALVLTTLRPRPVARRATRERGWSPLGEGVRFLARTPVLLAAITLDLFAVLLGGATTLLPIYARDILRVGPLGLGWLQAASSVGALCMALALAHRPPLARAGRALLLAVAGFGLATVGFGLSRSFALSFALLFLLGACDTISVVIRSTLVLLRTPDEMRGRVGAVNSLFIGTSNQLGGFESGLAAQLFGPVVAVVAGGIGTLLVVAAVARRWPEMRDLSTLREDPPGTDASVPGPHPHPP